jgi:hypothetical protein
MNLWMSQTSKPSHKTQDYVVGLTLKIEKQIRNHKVHMALVNDLNTIMAEAFGLEVSGQ